MVQYRNTANPNVPLIVVLFVVSVITVSAENLEVNSKEFPLFCSVLCLYSSMFNYPCVKVVEFTLCKSNVYEEISSLCI